MKVKSSYKWIIFAVLLSITLIGGIAFGQSEPAKGDVLRVAITGDPPTLDGQRSTSNIVGTITQHVFETLFAFDGELKPQPLLVDSYEIDKENLVYTLHLREGVLFHNSDEMRAGDVVASLERWMNVSSRGQQVAKNVKEVKAKDTYTVTISLTAPYSELPTFLALANAGAFIMPEEIIEETGDGNLEKYVGTGPYEFVRWESGNYILLERFEGYTPDDAKASRKAGKRVAYAKELRFIPVPETSTRLSGVMGGEYDLSMDLAYDMYPQLQNTNKANSVVVPAMKAPVFFFNHKKGITTNKKLREAFLAALDMEQIMQGAVGYPDLYNLGPNFSFGKESVWYTDAGKEVYNQANPDKAKELLKEAGYNNEPIKWIAMTGYPTIYWSTVVATQQLSNAGFNIHMEIYDPSTYFSLRSNADKWDVFTTYHGWVASPAQWSVMSSGYPGWWVNEEKENLLDEYMATYDIDKRAGVWEQIQQLIWDEVPIIRIGSAAGLMATSPELENFEGLLQPVLWNVWKEGWSQ